MTFQEAFHKDALVNHMVLSGCSLEVIIGALAKRHAELLLEFVNLESIAPKKYKLPDGTFRVWRCPEELLPVRDLSIV